MVSTCDVIFPFRLDGWGFIKGAVHLTRVYIGRLILLRKDSSDSNINMSQGRPFLRGLSHRCKTSLLFLWMLMGICPYEVRLQICKFTTLDSIRSHIHNIHAGKNSLYDSKNNSSKSKHDLKSVWVTGCFF